MKTTHPKNPRKCVLSDCGQYRYLLKESWSGLFPAVSLTWCMLNPSTADLLLDDPTVRKVRGFTSRLGFNGFQIVNLFAVRTPKPAVMKKHPSPVGEKNDLWIQKAALETPYVMLAWGGDGNHLNRAEKVMGNLRCAGIEMKYLKWFSDGGFPGHPLFLPYNLKPIKL